MLLRGRDGQVRSLLDHPSSERKSVNEVPDDEAPEVVLTERRGHVLIISMNRPAKRNAVDPAMSGQLSAAFDLLDDDPDLWAGVLTGTPEMFSAGNDLVAGSGSPSVRGGPYGLITRERNTPLIAAVEGFALGGGFELVLACDLVVAGASARFALPEVTRGVLPLYGGLFRTTRVLPLNIARELALTGEPLDAARAQRLGLVNHVTTDGQALVGALALAERICANAPTAVRHALAVINAVAATDDPMGWAQTSAAKQSVWASDDMQEGLRAFRERRSPRWSGQ
jgi:enoyl-CoA hydratase/carnithine racemase